MDPKRYVPKPAMATSFSIMSSMARLHHRAPSLVILLFAASVLFPSASFGQAFHGVSIQKNPVGPDGTARAHIGETIAATIRVRDLDDFNDSLTITSIVDVVHHNTTSPSHPLSTNEVSPNFLPSPIILRIFGDLISVTNMYVVEQNDGPVLRDDAQAGGIDNHDGDQGTFLPQSFTVTFPGQTRIIAPAITVAEICVFTGTPDNPTVAYSGVVSNAGKFNSTLTNVVLVSDNGTPGNLNDDVTILIGTLTNGQTATFNGSYTTFGSPSVNTVVARGTDELKLTVSNSAQCAVDIPCNPQLTLRKLCPVAPVPPGGILTFTGAITNTGNVTLTSVVVVNNQPAPNTPVLGPVTLAPGAGIVFTGTYQVPAALTNCTLTDTLTARATSICGGNVTNTATASCPVAPAAMGDIVFEDLNGDGVQDAGEPGVANATVRLLDCNRTVLATTLTGPQGQYLFTSLCPGSYVVQFVPPAGYTFTLPNVGADDARDSDADPVTGFTTCYALLAGETNRTVDAGLTRASGSADIRVTKSCPATPVAPGGLLVFTGTVTNTGISTLTNVMVVNNQPAPNTPVFGPVTLAPGAGVAFTASYRVPLDFCGPALDTLTARGTSVTGIGATNTATAACPVLTSPAIRVAKNCPANLVAPGGLLLFTGSVTNVGDVTLTNVIVVNNQPVPNVVVFGPATLAPGQVALFTNGYLLPPNFCGPASDTLTATARSICGSNVSHSATALCAVATNPRVQVTKTCPPSPVPPGGLLTLSGTVTNTGDVTLTNVLVFNDQPAANVLVFGPATLAPGAGAAFSASYFTPANEIGPWVDTLTASARSICGATVSASATATCPGLPDLVPLAINSGGALRAGQPLTFTWTVQNQGSSPATGPWRDHVYLVTNGVTAGASIALGDFPHSQTLLPGNSYAATQTVTGPVVPSGFYQLAVAVDSDNTVAEAMEGNNVAVQIGRLIVIGNEPLVEAFGGTNNQRRLILYGKPGTAYVLESTTSLDEPRSWQTELETTLSQITLPLTMPATNRTIYYRVRER